MVHTNAHQDLPTRVAVALSGGVDSAVAAALALREGHQVFGITMRLYEDPLPQGPSCPRPAPSCLEDAERVAKILGIEHRIVDLRSSFLEHVVKPFAHTYAQGQTPNPCITCNRAIKFGALMKAAQDAGATALVTGHYAKLIEGAGSVELHAAQDRTRDQSYFLYALSREQLAFARFPLGAFTKSQVRQEAEKAGLPVADKPDSQDICFVPGGCYADIVRRFNPEAFAQGDIVDMDGQVLGQHAGIAYYTVGQRRGLNLQNRQGESNDPLFVVRIDPERRRVIVGPRESLTGMRVGLEDVNWLGNGEGAAGHEVMVRLRSAQQPVPALYNALPQGRGEILLREPTHGIAPGQAAVMYQGTRVLGGGRISPLCDSYSQTK